jgi:hypothetical protein
MRVRNVVMKDFHDFGNALFGGGPAPKPVTVSARVRWSGIAARLKINNVAQNFAGKFIQNQAQMEWAATTEDFTFVSFPINTSSSQFAELGHMRNGSFSGEE